MSSSPRSSFLYWNGPVHSFFSHLKLVSILKYWFENRVGETTQGPSNPDRSE